MKNSVYDDAVVLIDEPYATVTYMPGFKFAKIVWNGRVSFEEYKHVFETILKNAEENETIRFASDLRKQGVVGPETRKWFEKEMIPRAIAAGLQRAAVITDANAFKRYYLNLILSSVNKFGLPFKLFGTDEEAIEFLAQDS
jgi:hypothetical protein